MSFSQSGIVSLSRYLPCRVEIIIDLGISSNEFDYALKMIAKSKSNMHQEFAIAFLALEDKKLLKKMLESDI